MNSKRQQYFSENAQWVLGKNQTEDSPSKNFHYNKEHTYTAAGSLVAKASWVVGARPVSEAGEEEKEGKSDWDN